MNGDQIVLVLGAGASSHAGYYVGSLFKAAICALRADEPFLAEAAAFGFPNVVEFLERFRFSGVGSPDQFLEDPRMAAYRDVGKFCIAYVLMNIETEDRLFPAGNCGWYQDLFARIGIESDTYVQNQMSAITYNYDRSLECALYKMIEARNRDDEHRVSELWRRRPEIVHVHGVLDIYDPDHAYHREYSQSNDFEVVQSASSQIQIIDEADPDTAEFRRARELLRRADRVIFLGFGFNKRNVDRLRVFDSEEQRQKIEGTLSGSGTRSASYVLNTVFGPGLNARKLEDRLIDWYIQEKL